MARALRKRSRQYAAGNARGVDCPRDDLEGLSIEFEVISIGAKSVHAGGARRHGAPGGGVRGKAQRQRRDTTGNGSFEIHIFFLERSPSAQAGALYSLGIASSVST